MILMWMLFKKISQHCDPKQGLGQYLDSWPVTLDKVLGISCSIWLGRSDVVGQWGAEGWVAKYTSTAASKITNGEKIYISIIDFPHMNLNYGSQ